MDISARTDYAVRALLTLAAAQAEGGGPVTAQALAEAQDLPQKFLESILLDLKRGGLVTARRGSSGGYLLARDAHEIYLGTVVRTVDGPLSVVRGQRPQHATYEGDAETLQVVWVALRSSVRSVLDEVSLRAVLAGDLPPHVSQLAAPAEAWVDR